MSKKPSSGSVRVLSMAVVTALAIGFASARPASAQAGYVVEDLGALAGDTSSVAWAINANGDVVGWSMGQAGTRAFLYTDAGGMVALPGLPDRPRTVARDINDAGVIVGSANAGGTDLGHAVLWSGGSVQDLGTLGTGFYSEAWGVNNLGQVVGWSYTNGGSGLTGVHGFLYSAGGGAGRPHAGQRHGLCPGHQRRGSGDGLQDRARRLSRVSLAGGNLRGPGRASRVRAQLWLGHQRVRPGGRQLDLGLGQQRAVRSVPPTEVVSRIWGAWASTTWPGASTLRARWLARAGNSAEACRPVHRRGAGCRTSTR